MPAPISTARAVRRQGPAAPEAGRSTEVTSRLGNGRDLIYHTPCTRHESCAARSFEIGVGRSAGSRWTSCSRVSASTIGSGVVMQPPVRRGGRQRPDHRGDHRVLRRPALARRRLLRTASGRDLRLHRSSTWRRPARLTDAAAMAVDRAGRRTIYQVWCDDRRAAILPRRSTTAGSRRARSLGGTGQRPRYEVLPPRRRRRGRVASCRRPQDHATCLADRASGRLGAARRAHREQPVVTAFRPATSATARTSRRSSPACAREGREVCDAGDDRQPAGDRWRAELLAAMGELRESFAEIGISGYPESHHFISDETTIEAMFAKEPMATYIVSQICFDADVIATWVRRVRERGTHLPIWIGVPGAVETRKLCARRCASSSASRSASFAASAACSAASSRPAATPPPTFSSSWPRPSPTPPPGWAASTCTPSTS